MAPRRDKRRGNVAIFAMLIFIMTLPFLALTIDLGYMMRVQSELQVAADAGALAGASVLRDGPDAAEAEAKTFAELNKAGGNDVYVVPDDDIEVGYWDTNTNAFTALTGAARSNANAIRVTCRLSSDASRGQNNALPLFFASLFGWDVIQLEASAVSRAKTSDCGKILGNTRVTFSGTCYTDSYHSDEGPYVPAAAGNNGDVCTNGPIIMSGANVINGDAHPGVGMPVFGGTVTETTSSLTEPLDFPPIDFGDVATNNDNAAIPLTALGNTPVNGLGQLVLPVSDTLDLPPGVYYFTQMGLAPFSTLRTSGLTVIYCSGNCLVSFGAVLNSSLVPGNLQIFANGAQASLNGDTDFHAVLYAPNARVIRGGAGDFFGMMVGRELTFNGSGGVHADQSLGVLFGIENKSVLVD